MKCKSVQKPKAENNPPKRKTGKPNDTERKMTLSHKTRGGGKKISVIIRNKNEMNQEIDDRIPGSYPDALN